MDKLSEFIRMSKFAGMREDIVQAGGGNTSVKLNENEMIIKASGTQLAEIDKECGYAIVNQKVISDFFMNMPTDEINQESEKVLLQKAYISGARPSIETFLHAITDIFTLHTHPVLVNVLTARRGGMEVLKSLFPQALIVEYATPGIELAKEYFNKYNSVENKNFDIIFLKNHGLIVSGKSAEEVIEKTEKIISNIAHFLKTDISKYSRITTIYNAFTEIYKEEYKEIIYLSNSIYSKTSKVEEVGKYQFCPDCLVYCGKKALYLDEGFTLADIEKHIENYGRPTVIYCQDSIYISAESLKKAKEIESVLNFSLQVVALNRGFEMEYLKDEEQNFLLNWEAEKYRKTIK